MTLVTQTRRKNRKMPTLKYVTLKQIIQKDEDGYGIFVETGTWQGSTIFRMEPHFKELHTIEIKKLFYDSVRRKYNGNKITFHLGDSAYELGKVVKNLSGNTVFFLDGHWSAGDTGRGEKDCPLYEELLAITTLFLHKAIIIIDDIRLFGKGPNIGNCNHDWEDISYEGVLNIVKDRLISNYVTEDRMIIHLKSKLTNLKKEQDL